MSKENLKIVYLNGKHAAKLQSNFLIVPKIYFEVSKPQELNLMDVNKN
jgi:hypothetical protein